MRLRTNMALAATTILFLVGAIGAPASAAEPTVELPSTGTSVSYSPECLEQVGAEEREQCKLVTTMSLGAEQIVSVAEIKADMTLSAADKSSLLEAAAIAAVSSKNYSQFTTGVFYTVTHGGKFYYDGTRAWVGTTYAGSTGSHNCTVNYTTVGIAIDTCNESGSVYQRDMYMAWTVQALPIWYSVNMTVKLYGNGTASGPGYTLS